MQTLSSVDDLVYVGPACRLTVVVVTLRIIALESVGFHAGCRELANPKAAARC
jgi:hypothetical protein